MKILSIETSCDETGVSLVEAKGGLKDPSFKVISDLTISQIKLHKKYGGVFPNLAKREHSRNLVPILKKVLEQGFGISNSQFPISKQIQEKIEKILEREPELLKQFLEFIPKIKRPNIDRIAVTYGPGLEPALWVGINFAKALSLIWEIPIIPANHMEGHMTSVLIPKENKKVKFPALALLISGGHTELVLIKKWGDYKIIGRTRDDAVGECFDKTARMIGLPYPGGPEISKLAEKARIKKSIKKIDLPKPMINSPDLDFSFSGLKTSVLYYLRDNPIKNNSDKESLAKALEETITEVLISKTEKAIKKYKAKTLIIAGGVSANKFIRKSFEEKLDKEIQIFIPSIYLSTDNGLMIASAGYISELSKRKYPKEIKAQGNLSLGKE